MSEAFRCDYCKEFFEGRPFVNHDPSWPIPRTRLRTDITLQRGEESWLLRASPLVTVFVNGKRADLCRDCRRTLSRAYAESCFGSQSAERATTSEGET